MNYLVNVCTAVVILGFTFTSVSCLKCHECNTNTPGQEDCEKIAEGNKKYLVNCTAPKDKSCRIQEQTVETEMLKQDTGKRTIRQCASTEFDPDRPCYYRSGFGGKVGVCNCLEDGCNEATRTVSALLMTIVLFFMVKMFS